jgi:hypothetical protein
VSISSTLNARILRTNVLSYVCQSRNVTRKADKKRLLYEKFARLTLMKLTVGRNEKIEEGLNKNVTTNCIKYKIN